VEAIARDISGNLKAIRMNNLFRLVEE
jgi:hypothetical protein